MPCCTTKYFEAVEYEEAAVVDFPAGLPGFENERRFLSLEQPAHLPLVFLQSLATPELCFVTLPATTIDPSYALEIEDADCELIGLDPLRGAASDRGLLTLALVTIAESGMTANLLAPIVINTANLRAVQAISPGRSYSHLHPLGEAWEPVCS